MAEPTLDEILSGDEAETTEVVEEKVDTEETTEEVKAEPEVETKEEEAEPTAAKPQIEPDQFKGYLDEREKRQAAEKREQDLRKQLDEREPVKPADILEDPEAFHAEQARGRDQLRFDIQKEMMQDAHEDYDEAEKWALEATGSNVALAQMIANSTNLPKTLYKMWTDQKAIAAIGDPEEFKTRLRAEILAELKQEVGTDATAQAEALAEKEDALKPSLAAAGEAGSETVIEESLEDMVGRDANDRR